MMQWVKKFIGKRQNNRRRVISLSKKGCPAVVAEWLVARDYEIITRACLLQIADDINFCLGMEER